MEIRCRWAPSIGSLEDTAEKIWGTKPYNPETDQELPTVFFGLYGLPDFYALWRHKGKKWVLWAGSDVTHFSNGYWLEDGGGIRLDPTPLARWLEKNVENWVENDVEREALADLGITARVCPSFLGNVDDFPVSFEPNKRPKVYLSANPGREVEYGWQVVEDIADKCNADFYLYGSPHWTTKHHNVFVRGRVPKEVMNEEIKNMQCGLRLNEIMDGFSEITAKAVLWGQYPITWGRYNYPHLMGFKDPKNLITLINSLAYKTEPNPAREYYRNVLNAYPWKQN